MSRNSERSKAIRERIKNELGYNSKQVSVRSSYCGYSSETSITVKDLSCDFEAIEKIAKSFEKVDYDQYTGEILSGGNTYISVAYDWGVLHQAEEKENENAEKAINEADLENEARNQTFYTDKQGGQYVIIPSGLEKSTRRYSLAYFAKEELKAIMGSVINGHYSQDEFDLFKAEYGWEDWMNDYTDAEEDEEISETESREIDAVLVEGFKMAFDADQRQIYGI